MEVEIISKEVIRPSSPTPAYLKVFKTSLIDQIMGENLVRLISFYARKDQNFKISEVLNRLKSSLSETLTRYYPLAGIGRDSSTKDCNDKGALVVIVQVNCSMAEITRHPKFEHFHKFGTSSKAYEDEDFQLSFQFNIFSCGCIAIYNCFSHRISDATTMSAFLKCWAAIARGSPELEICPEYKSGMLFPARESVPDAFSIITERLKLEEGKSSRRRRFVFSAVAIANLKAKASIDGVSNPTRVEVVSGFIWKHVIAAAKVVCGVQQPPMLVQFADIRRRMVPPMPDYSAGNLIWFITSEYEATHTDQDVKFRELVQPQREAKLKNRDEFVPQLQNNGGYKVIYKSLEELSEKCINKSLNLYLFSSWCKIGITEVDFGWEKPIWFSQVGGTEVELMFKNSVGLIDGGSEDETEAWLILDQREMTVLESNEEFLAFASPNPAISISEE